MKPVMSISLIAISILGLILSSSISSINADSHEILSPRQQMAAGVEAEDVECREGFVLMIRVSNGAAACVKSETSVKLSVVGWGDVIVDDEKDDMMEDDMMEDDMMEDDMMEDDMMEDDMPGNETRTMEVELEEGLAMGEEDAETPPETPEEDAETPEEEPFTIGGIDLSMAASVEGNVEAPITIIEFGDYQCPNCKEWFQQQKPIIKNDHISSGTAKLYFIDFTFLGDDSINAAQASHCAGDQGKFMAYHSTLYNAQAGIEDGWASVDALKQFAIDLELDSVMFDECLDSGKYEARVSHNTEVGASGGVTGTPHFFIVAPDGKLKQIMGPQPSVVFDAAILSLGY
jgi:protein-disulfide isomerase